MRRTQLLKYADRAAIYAGFTAAERLQMREALSNPSVTKVARTIFYNDREQCGCPLVCAGFVSPNTDHTNYVYAMNEAQVADFYAYFDFDTSYIEGQVIQVEA